MSNEPIITRIDCGYYDGLQGMAKLKSEFLAAMGSLYEDKFSFMAHQHSGMEDPGGREYRKAVVLATVAMDAITVYCTAGMMVSTDPVQALTTRGFYVALSSVRLANDLEIRRWSLPIGPSEHLTPTNQNDFRVGEGVENGNITPRRKPKLYYVRAVVRVATLADVVAALTDSGYIVHEAKRKVADKKDTFALISGEPIPIFASIDASKNRYAAGPLHGVWL